MSCDNKVHTVHNTSRHRNGNWTYSDTKLYWLYNAVFLSLRITRYLSLEYTERSHKEKKAEEYRWDYMISNKTGEEKGGYNKVSN